MIVREAMDTFIPFSGTGMGFHRKAIYYLEKSNGLQDGLDIHKEAELTNNYFKNNEEPVKDEILVNDTSYKDDPFASLNAKSYIPPRGTPNQIRQYTTVFVSVVLMFVSFLVYTGVTENNNESQTETVTAGADGGVFENIMKKVSFNSAFASNLSYENMTLPDDIVKVSNFFKDTKYDAIYLIKENKVSIEESHWNYDEGAKNRLSEVQSILGFDKTKGLVIKSIINEDEIYKVIIGEYNSLDEARNNLITLREAQGK
jgi:hypothetical protein